MAMSTRSAGDLIRADVVSGSIAQPVAAGHGLQPEAAAADNVSAILAANVADGAEQQVDYRVQKRWEIADTLRRQAESAWQAGAYRAAVAYYRQSWAVMPGFPPLDTAREKRWEIADRLQREGNAAWQAGDVRHAASLYHQSQAVLPW